jgi:riboflavin kinase/FMN adenylyltransferase
VRPVVTIGNFDGVHLGHRALLAAARDLGRRLAKTPGEPRRVTAVTFDPTPRDVMQPGHGIPQIQTLADRVRTLREAGADAVVVEPFTRELAGWSPERFADEILGVRLGARGIVVGWDFRFGHDRAGDAELLRHRLGVPVEQVGPVLLDGEPVSSTRVRRAVLAGDLDLAARLLDRPHEIVGPVVVGDRRGRTIGFPTANVRPETALLPPPGVYAVRAVLPGGELRGGVANLGERPTFGPGRGRLEVHLFDFDGDLYDAPLRVQIVARLREERAFPTLEALVTQIRADADAARARLVAR